MVEVVDADPTAATGLSTSFPSLLPLALSVSPSSPPLQEAGCWALDAVLKADPSAAGRLVGASEAVSNAAKYSPIIASRVAKALSKPTGEATLPNVFNKRASCVF